MMCYNTDIENGCFNLCFFFFPPSTVAAQESPDLETNCAVLTA